jgi:putative FmdB family regulatory protein
VPIYVYECSSCGERFEYAQSMSEAPKTVCESCSGKLEKVIVPIAFHLKGGGWYKDLYSSKKAKEGSGSSSASSPGSGDGDAKSESKADTKGDAKTETKPETKSEAKSEAKAESKSAAKPSDK